MQALFAHTVVRNGQRNGEKQEASRIPVSGNSALPDFVATPPSNHTKRLLSWDIFMGHWMERFLETLGFQFASRHLGFVQAAGSTEGHCWTLDVAPEWFDPQPHPTLALIDINTLPPNRCPASA